MCVCVLRGVPRAAETRRRTMAPSISPNSAHRMLVAPHDSADRVTAVGARNATLIATAACLLLSAHTRHETNPLPAEPTQQTHHESPKSSTHQLADATGKGQKQRRRFSRRREREEENETKRRS